MTRLCSAIAGLLLLGAAADARPLDPLDHAAVMESLSSVHPRLRGRWLRDRGIEDPVRASSGQSPESLGLTLVGRWSYGPAYDVDCRMTPTDTFIALARGSGVSIARLNRSTSTRFEVLSDINCDRSVGDVRLLDTLVLVSCYGLEVWGISDPTRPNRHCRIETDLLGFDARDSLVYMVGYDSFQVISVADPANPRLVGACRDSGSAVSVAGNTAYVANIAGLFAIDVSNPAAPHRVGSWGGQILSVAARGNICCVTQTNPNQPSWLGFTILNTINPAALTPLGSLNNVGGYDICLDGNRALLSGYQSGGHEFRIVDIGDSTQPAVIGTCATQNNNYGVWGTTAGDVALVADNRGGLAVIDITNQTQPSLDTVVLRGGSAVDISIDAGLGYVASDGAGLKVLDLSSPASPQWIGDLDTTHNDLTIEAAEALDSFAFIGWRRPYLRVADVTDPTRPLMAAGCNVVAAPKALALRDSLLYLAADGQFDVVNVARPRQPRVVGTVNLPGMSREVVLADTLAYVAGQGMQVISVANPTDPRIIGSWDRYARGIDLQDTILYAVTYTNSTEDVLVSLDVTNPTSPAVIDSVIVPRTMHDVLVVDTVAYCVGWEVQLASVADPANLRLLPGRWSPPSWVRRAVYRPSYIYMCQTDAGVAIYEPVQAGISEERPGGEVGRAMRVWPSVTRGRVSVGGRAGPWRLLDVTGKVVAEGSSTGADIDLSRLAPGVYFVSPASSVKRDASGVTKVVITR